MKKQIIVGMLTNILSGLWLCGENMTGFRGNNRQGIFAGSGLLKAWPEGGLEPLWVYSELGAGWGSPTIVDDRIFITGSDPANPKMEMLTCLNAKGEKQWSVQRRSLGKIYLRCPYHTDLRAWRKSRGRASFVITGAGVLVCVAEKTAGLPGSRMSLRTIRGNRHLGLCGICCAADGKSLPALAETKPAWWLLTRKPESRLGGASIAGSHWLCFPVF